MTPRILLLISFFGVVCSSITEYSGEVLNSNQLYYQKEGIYADNAPLTNYFGPSKISFKFDFNVSSQPTKGYLHTEVLLFTNDQQPGVGLKIDDTREYCCYNDMVAKGQCTQPGSAIYDPTKVVFSWVADWYNLTFTGNLTVNNMSASQNSSRGFATLFNSTAVNQQLNITDSAFYTLWVISCGETRDYDGKVLIQGNVQMLSIYGWLPGELAPLEILWWILFVFYFIWLCFWLRLVTRYNGSTAFFHHLITIVLFLALLENLLNASSYAAYNFRGHGNLGLNIFIFVVATFKMTLSLAGLLLVTMGYTITRPILPKGHQTIVWLMSFIYFGIDFIYQCLAMIQRSATTTQGAYVSPGVVSFFLILLVIADFAFLTMIYVFLVKTILGLKVATNKVKYVMFRNLGLLLAFFCFASVIIFAVQLAGSATEQEDNWWRGTFFFTGYWDIMHLLIIVPLSWWWRPTSDKNRYAYDPTDDQPTRVVDLDTNPEREFTPQGELSFSDESAQAYNSRL